MSDKERYSDEELEEFRQLILEKLEVAEHDFNRLMESINSNDNDETMPTYKALEEGSVLQSKDELAFNAQRLQKFITGLKAALIRIENKTYGVCRVTGKLIPKERLRAVPHATLSIEAKNAQNNQRR